MSAKEIAQKAADLVGGDRKEAYGDVMDGLGRIAVLWNGLLTVAGKAPQQPINEHDVAQMMVSLKQARAYTGPLRTDNHIDEAGWAAIAGEAAARLDELGPREVADPLGAHIRAVGKILRGERS